MVRQSGLGLAMGLALAIALVATCLVLGIAGAAEKPTRLALEITARWSFLLFWLAYAGNALAKITGRTFLMGKGREFGLAFAAAHLVHVGLVLWLSCLLGRIALSGALLVFFMAALFFTYLLAALSFGGAKAIGPRAWRVIRFIGMNYILIAFVRDFWMPLLHPKPTQHTIAHIIAYAPFAALSAAAPLLVAATAWRPSFIMRPEAGA